MADPAKTYLYHITDIANLPSIVSGGRLLSDVLLGAAAHTVIGYGHIKLRRMTELRVPCCGNRFVGEFVPFYYCPRSPMLYTVNKGNTGKPAGCQRDIVHLVTTVSRAADLGVPWAISDGNAGAWGTTYRCELAALDDLDWQAIRANSWAGRVHQKSAEFLVADSFPWTSIVGIGCYNLQAVGRVAKIVDPLAHKPKVLAKSDWYYP